MGESQDQFQTSKKPNGYNNYLKYSGLAVQFLAVIALCGWVGYKLDKLFDLRYPVLMIVLGFLGFGGMMVQLYRSINRQ